MSYSKAQIEEKLADMRREFVKSLKKSPDVVQITTSTTTVDMVGLKARSPWEDCKRVMIDQLSLGMVNKGVYIEVDVCCNAGIMTALMTCVQDASGFVELSLYNWLPKAHVRSERDLDWAMPRGARIRIREPYLKRGIGGDPFMAILLGMPSAGNIFIRVDNPSDVRFVKPAAPDFAKRFAHLVGPLLSPKTVSTLPAVGSLSSVNYLRNVEARPSSTGDGLFLINAVKKDGLVFSEKATACAKGQFGHAYHASGREIDSMGTHALFEELVFLDRCSGGMLYTQVLSRLFPANKLGDEHAIPRKIYEVVTANVFGVADSDTDPESAHMEFYNGAALWATASKMNHACAPNVWYTIKDDTMYVYARDNLAAGTELLVRYIEPGLEVPRKYGLPGQLRYFECKCCECKAWTALGPRGRWRVEAVHDAVKRSESEIRRVCQANEIDFVTGKGLDLQAIYILKIVAFKLANCLLWTDPEISLRILLRLIQALRKFDLGLMLVVPTHLCIAIAYMLLRKPELSKTNVLAAYGLFKRMTGGSKIQFLHANEKQMQCLPRSMLT
ncbi:hypothetical protein BGZ73_007935 [Actinomortierella ambigua]|nr:hypothetical protein BGZ73_007935 [Actinomortierella ambigua]